MDIGFRQSHFWSGRFGPMERFHTFKLVPFSAKKDEWSVQEGVSPVQYVWIYVQTIATVIVGMVIFHSYVSLPEGTRVCRAVIFHFLTL